MFLGEAKQTTARLSIGFTLVLLIMSFITPSVRVRAEGTRVGYDYTQTAGGIGTDLGRAIVADSQGNVYTAGEFYGTVDFDPGAGTDNKTTISSWQDIYLTRTSSDGAYEWTKTIGNSSSKVVFDIAVDGNDNVYVVGNFSGTVDFDPGAGTDNKTASSKDGFVMKINADGTYGWTYKFGSTNFDSIIDVAIDELNNVYLAGYFSNTVDFDPGAGTDSKTSAGSQDAVLIKLDSNGTYQSVKAFGSSGSEYARSVTADENNNVYVVGNFSGTVDFDPGAGTDSKSHSGSGDAFLTRINSDGSYGWTRTINSAQAETLYSIKASSDGKIYGAGHFYGTVDFDPGAGTDSKTPAGSADVFLTSYDSSGTYLTTQTFAGSGNDSVSDIDIDAENNVYVFGSFNTTVDFDPGAGTDNKSAVDGYYDVFLTRINEDGSYAYTEVFGSDLFEYAESVDVVGTEIYMAGYFEGTVDFDPTDGVDQHSPYPNGDYDIFRTKFTQTTYQQITNLDPTLTAKTLSDTDATDNTIERGTATTIRLSTTDNIPLADVTTTFTTDLDWSSVTADVDPDTGKAFVHNLTAADGTSGTYTLYVPKLAGHNTVGVCPGANALATLTTTCTDLYYLSEGDDTLTTTTIDGQDYWAITGLTGTGAFGLTATEATDTTTDSDNETLAETGQGQTPILLGSVVLCVLAMILIRHSWRVAYRQ